VAWFAGWWQHFKNSQGFIGVHRRLSADSKPFARVTQKKTAPLPVPFIEAGGPAILLSFSCWFSC
jgi:hypothetical protein